MGKKKEIEFKLSPGRRTGRTTRLADEYVQKFWEKPGEWIEIRDHHPTTLMARGMVISIGWNKNGEPDFEVSSRVGGLTLEEMKELRAMIPVAIGTAENMYRSAQSMKEKVKACKA